MAPTMIPANAPPEILLFELEAGVVAELEGELVCAVPEPRGVSVVAAAAEPDLSTVAIVLGAAESIAPVIPLVK